MMKNKYWVVIQTVLLLLILFWPLKIKVLLPAIINYVGMIFLIIGFILVMIAVKALKDNFKPSLKPRIGGKLITIGLYSIVRHPVYGAILISAFGFSLWMDDGARLILSACLLLFFDLKSRMEEKWLEKTYPEYNSYKKQVTKRFIPWVY